MSVYYKFRSAKDYDKVDFEGHFISVGVLKEKVFELKRLHMGTDYDLVVENAQTNEEYLDEAMLIPKNTSVLIRRVPGRPRKPIITAPASQQEELIVDNNSADRLQALKEGSSGAEPSAMKHAEDLDWDEFGNDLYAIPEPVSFTPSIPAQDAPPVSKEDEDNMIKALIDTSALDWQRQISDVYATSGRGFGRMNGGGRMSAGRGFGRGGFEKKTPPEGYVCHRCKVPGHFIQHCPTNGDPTFDIKRFKPPTGIPKSMLVPTTDGSYALPSGGSGVLKPNEAAFEKEIEGMPSTRSVGELPPELHCPLCKEVMKDAVLTSKCCFTSFCDKCIRDHIISKSMCVCGATNVLADDLLPNKTVRVTINRILESNNSSDDNGGRTFLVQDMESRNPQAKVPSPTESAASKGQQMLAPPRPQGEETSKIPEPVVEEKLDVAQLQENPRAAKIPDVSEATHESRGVKEAASQGSAQLAEEEVHQKPLSGDAGKKKKKKKIRVNPGDAEMQWRGAQDIVPENYMMPMGPSGFNPYWNGMQPGFDGFMPPFPGPMPYMGYGPSPMDVAFGGVFPPDPFGGMNCMMPYGPPPVQRDLSELARGFNVGPPAVSREQFEARKVADLKRKREMERNREREFSKDRDYGREVSSAADVSPVKSKSRAVSRQLSDENHHQQPSRHRSERRASPDRRSRDLDLPRPSSKKKSDQDLDYSHHEDARHHRSRDHHGEEQRQRGRSSSQGRSEPEAPTSGDKKQKRSVFSRISFPEPAPKKVKLSSASEPAAAGGSSSHRAASISNGYHDEHKVMTGSKKSSASIAMDQDSSDDERHFKRRPSRYTSSPPPPVEEEPPRHSRGSRGRDRDRERGGYNKYR